MRIHTPLLFLFVFTLNVYSQEIALPDDVVASIQKRIVAGTNPSISIGIIDENGPVYFNFGLKQEGGEKVNEHSIYEIGSISKIFTSTLLADNIIKGDMKADDPAQEYLPENVHLPMYEGQYITLGHLADHTSSLPRLPSNFNPADPMNPYADYTIDQLYDFLSSYKLTRPIGSEYEYSNLAVGLLGHILSLKAGIPYENLMLNKIAVPLQMNETRITLDENMKKNLAHPYVNGQEVSNWDLPTLAGAGAIRSSVYDLIKFVSAEMGLTKTPLAEAMALTHQPRHHKAGGHQIGLAWFIDPDGDQPIFSHGGATGGYRAFIGFKGKTGVVLLTNSDQDAEDIALHLLDPDSPLREIKPKVITNLRQIIDNEGSNGLVKKFKKLKKDQGDKISIDENDINSLGYWYMNNKKSLNAAVALFKINVMEFPFSSNVYDSYGEGLMNLGKTRLAIKNYKESLRLNPGNSNAVDKLAQMGIKMDLPEVKVDENILQTYVGTYEIVPGFDIEVTKEQGQLFAQASGQDKFEIFPKSSTSFYYKVVDAQIDFNKNADGKVESLTLHQGGIETKGKKKN